MAPQSVVQDVQYKTTARLGCGSENDAEAQFSSKQYRKKVEGRPKPAVFYTGGRKTSQEFGNCEERQ